jgi:hypothetical protein
VSLRTGTGRSRGFDFVLGSGDAAKAIGELNGLDVEGRQLQVNEARPQGIAWGRGPFRWAIRRRRPKELRVCCPENNMKKSRGFRDLAVNTPRLADFSAAKGL